MTLQADVIVAAVGKRNVLTADMVKPGAVVIDVGMNRNDEGKLCGDVDFAGVKKWPAGSPRCPAAWAP
jgi:methylenetetrahydrofolate dehydrogenase (NADP+)/methenyltetrahydrofolate cyclohydrolase